MKRLLPLLLVLAMFLLLNPLARAHKPSDSYLQLHAGPQQLTAQLDVALRDLDVAIGLDADGDGALTWGEVRRAEARISSYVLARLELRRGSGMCQPQLEQLLINQHVDGAYAALMLRLDCAAADGAGISVAYRLLFDVDPLHRSVVSLHSGGTVTTGILAADAALLTLDPQLRPAWRQWLDFVGEGVWHIWIGYDHILFLLSLLLPAVLQLRGRQWQPAASFGPVLRDAAAIVTAFTVAHSITLSLAAFELVRLPTRLVESAIALSVIVVALNNIFPLLQRWRWGLTFGFGLIHGFGFAAVLSELQLGTGSLLLTVSAFNIGVELGQLAIVCLFLPLAFRLRHSGLYLPLGLRAGSAAIALLAALWLAERALNLQLLPGV